MVIYLVLVYNLFFLRVISFLENLNFYFMKTANIPVYGNSAVYGNIAVFIKDCAVCLKNDYTLICLEYICSVPSP